MKSILTIATSGLAALVLSTGQASATGTILFSDTFSSGTNGGLNGQAPETRPGSQTWTSTANFSKNTTTGVVSTSGTGGAAYLATPTFDLSKIYTVTGRVTNNLASNDADWIGIGFTTQTTTTNAWNTSGTGTYWMLWRGNDEVRAFNGAGATGSAGSTGVLASGESNTLDLRVMLDFTTGGFGTVSYMYKNPGASAWTTYTTSSISETLRNNIKGVGFTALDTNTSITSFEYTVVPEPSTALGGLLLTAGLLRRRRSVCA